MQRLKQSTAATVKLGPFLDDTDGKTAETGLTISQADIRLSKNGGDFAQTNNSAGATHDENGWYDVPLDATDTNTPGRLIVAVHESGALPVWREFEVVPANVYDSLFSTDKLQVDVTQIGGDAQSATDLKDFADTGYDPSTHEIAGITATVDANLIQIDGNATNGNNATLYLKKLDIQNSDGDAVNIASTGNNGNGVKIAGNGQGKGIYGDTISMSGNVSINGGLYLQNTNSYALLISSGATGGAPALLINATGTGHAVRIDAGGDGTHALYLRGGLTSGNAIYAVARGGNSDAVKLEGNGTGQDIKASEIDDIKTATDQLNFSGTDVKATLDGETVDVGKLEGVALSSKVGDNFNVYWQNGGSDSTVTVDDLGFVKKFINNKKVIDTSGNTLTLYDDDGTTVLAVWPLKDKDASGITFASGVVAQVDERTT